MIALDNVYKTYSTGVSALNGISMKIKKGEFVFVVGSSGSGTVSYTHLDVYKRQVRRQEILDTAMQLFYEKGYEKTSITDIAKNMGVAQGLCYRYFTSKEEIFDTALDQYAQKLVERLTDGILEKPGPLRQIIIEMPTFLDVEWEDSFYYKVCHGSENLKTHRQLSMRVCEKLMPIIEKVDVYKRQAHIRL